MWVIPGSGRSPGEGHVNPFQYSSLENPMDRGTWWAEVHGVAESDMTEATDHTHTRKYRTLYVRFEEIEELINQLPCLCI